VDENSRRANREFDRALTALQPRVQRDKDFAEKLFAALCNVTWKHAEMPELEFSCSWRTAGDGDIVSSLVEGRGGSDYLDFYLLTMDGSVTVGSVAQEVEDALAKLGWVAKPDDAA
jgi:hypothetical protein